MASADDILEQCVEQVVSGRSTVDDCLRGNPQYADALGPLLETALAIDRLDRPRASHAAIQVGRRLMIDAIARREHESLEPRVPPSERAKRWFRVPQLDLGTGLATTRLAAVAVLGSVTVLVWIAALGLLVRAWHGTLVPQTCVVAEASGVALVQTKGDAEWQPLEAGGVLQQGHLIRTGDPGGITLALVDGSITWLGPNGELEIAQLGARRDGAAEVVVLRQAAGSTHHRVGSQRNSGLLFAVETASASVTVRGTEFKVQVGPDGSTSVVVFAGVVSVAGRDATVTVSGGQATRVDADQDPGPVVMAPAEELVERPVGGEAVHPSPEPQAKPSEPAATLTKAAGSPAPTSPEASVVVKTPTSTSESPKVETVTPETDKPTATSKLPQPTATTKPPKPTQTPKPAPPTVTPKPPTPTSTPKPPTPTATTEPSPTQELSEVVEVFFAVYKESKEELRVKARTSGQGCTLNLEAFGPMVPEGDHWLYVERELEDDDVPSTVTVRSSCGASDTSIVRWE